MVLAASPQNPVGHVFISYARAFSADRGEVPSRTAHFPQVEGAQGRSAASIAGCWKESRSDAFFRSIIGNLSNNADLGFVEPCNRQRQSGCLTHFSGVLQRRKAFRIGSTQLALAVKEGVMESESPIAKSRTHVPKLGVSQDSRKAVHGEHPIGRFNSRLAVLITKSVGSMWCAYVFALLALVSFPAAINSHDPIVIVSWIAQTFLQLALLPIIIVGQNVQAASNDARAQSDHETLLAIRALSLLQLGERQLEARNIQSALRTYQEAYALDPDNPATNYFLGYLYAENRQIEKGIEHLKHALTQNEQYPPAEAALAYALRLQADQITDPMEKKLRYSESEQMFLRALSQDPAMRDINGESFHAALGALYKRQERTDEAIEAYKEAELATPQNSYPIVNLATLYYLSGDLEQAKQYYERSAAISSRMLDVNPFDYWARFDLSAAQLVLGNLEQAKWQFNLAAQQVRQVGPLETFLHDLERLKNAPTSPKGVDELIDLGRNAIKRIRNSSDKDTKA